MYIYPFVVYLTLWIAQTPYCWIIGWQWITEGKDVERNRICLTLKHSPGICLVLLNSLCTCWYLNLARGVTTRKPMLGDWSHNKWLSAIYFVTGTVILANPYYEVLCLWYRKLLRNFQSIRYSASALTCVDAVVSPVLERKTTAGHHVCLYMCLLCLGLCAL